MKIEIEKRINPVFGSISPVVLIKDQLSARATASSKRIRLRKDATFSNKDVDQLVNQQAFIHVATTLNGKLQKNIKILGAKYGSITKLKKV